MLKKKKLLIILLPLICLCAALFIFINVYLAHDVEALNLDTLNNYNLNGKNNLMIVAHPDDEAIWGGAQLLNKDWCVVCITGGNNKTRAEEFQKSMQYCGCTGIILDYPDKVNLMRDNWNAVEAQIQKDIAIIINCKNWNKIATHNPDGEYGHIQHKLTSKTVTDICKKSEVYDKLYYFGKYYTKDNIKNITGLKEIESSQKISLDELLSVYSSQQSTIDSLRHMVYYESWVKSENWQ